MLTGSLLYFILPVLQKRCSCRIFVETNLKRQETIFFFLRVRIFILYK